MEGNGDKKRRMAQLRFSLSVLSATAQLIIQIQRQTDKYKDKKRRIAQLRFSLSVLSATAQLIIQIQRQTDKYKDKKRRIAQLRFSLSVLSATAQLIIQIQRQTDKYKDKKDEWPSCDFLCLFCLQLHSILFEDKDRQTNTKIKKTNGSAAFLFVCSVCNCTS